MLTNDDSSVMVLVCLLACPSCVLGTWTWVLYFSACILQPLEQLCSTILLLCVASCELLSSTIGLLRFRVVITKLSYCIPFKLYIFSWPSCINNNDNYKKNDKRGNEVCGLNVSTSNSQHNYFLIYSGVNGATKKSRAWH